MSSDRLQQSGEGETPVVGAGYARLQLARALTTQGQHPDPDTRERARRRASDWETVFNGILDHSLAVGSRTPLKGAPEWATLRVLTGGFATGDLMADGPLQPHEQALLARFAGVPAEEPRLLLNRFYLTDDGLAELQSLLQSGCYDLDLPEEGALLVVAWLIQQGRVEVVD